MESLHLLCYTSRWTQKIKVKSGASRVASRSSYIERRGAAMTDRRFIRVAVTFERII
jgi:hypothetical protein